MPIERLIFYHRLPVNAPDSSLGVSWPARNVISKCRSPTLNSYGSNRERFTGSGFGYKCLAYKSYMLVNIWMLDRRCSIVCGHLPIPCQERMYSVELYSKKPNNFFVDGIRMSQAKQILSISAWRRPIYLDFKDPRIMLNNDPLWSLKYGNLVPPDQFCTAFSDGRDLNFRQLSGRLICCLNRWKTQNIESGDNEEVYHQLNWHRQNIPCYYYLSVVIIKYHSILTGFGLHLLAYAAAKQLHTLKHARGIQSSPEENE